MRVIPPIIITNAMLTASTCAEPGSGETAYNAGTTYAARDRVYVGTASSTVSFTGTEPVTINWASHGQADGTPVVITSTVSLPSQIVSGRTYYIVNRASGTFQISDVPNGAPINISGSFSGTITATTHIHRRFESLVGSNTGHYPTDPASSTYWFDIGPTNRWAMFDLLRNTGSVGTSPLEVTLTPAQRVDAIALVGLVADEVTVTVEVDSEEVYSSTTSLSTRVVTTWYEYFFEPFAFKAAAAMFDLPPYTDGVIKVSITRSAGPVTCGGVIIGQSVYLGSTLHDAQNDALNFSTIDRSADGSALLTQRRSVPKTVQTTRFDKAIVSRLTNIRTSLNAEPALWSALDDQSDAYFEPLLILGIYKRFTVNLDQPSHGLLELELEEV